MVCVLRLYPLLSSRLGSSFSCCASAATYLKVYAKHYAETQLACKLQRALISHYLIRVQLKNEAACRVCCPVPPILDGSAFYILERRPLVGCLCCTIQSIPMFGFVCVRVCVSLQAIIHCLWDYYTWSTLCDNFRGVCNTALHNIQVSHQGS
jgi:hypothetical protein